jgi:Pyridoxamine 5'-phosphate oxidase
MSARAGDLEFLDHPIAQHLLTSTEPAQLAYTWLDGTPRTVPIWFHWDGEAVVFGTPPRAPKLAALRANPAVAVTIDEHVWPYKVLYLRGIASIDTTDDVSPEYSAGGGALLRSGAGQGLGGSGARPDGGLGPTDVANQNEAGVGQPDRLPDAIPERLGYLTRAVTLPAANVTPSSKQDSHSAASRQHQARSA